MPKVDAPPFPSAPVRTDDMTDDEWKRIESDYRFLSRKVRAGGVCVSGVFETYMCIYISNSVSTILRKRVYSFENNPQVLKEAQERVSLRSDFQYKMTSAKSLLNDEFFSPHNLDFRYRRREEEEELNPM